MKLEDQVVSSRSLITKTDLVLMRISEDTDQEDFIQ